MKNLFYFTCVIVICMALSGCKKDQILSNSKTFNVALFKQNLINQITFSAATQPRGYAFAINQGGLLVDTASFGTAAINPAGGTAINQSVFRQINIASVTKLFTGIAVMQLLEKNGLDITDKIGAYLPAYWNATLAVRNLTFEELMTHSSGLNESNTSWDSLKATVARGLDTPGKPADVYANINFALFRAMIPYMEDKDAAEDKEDDMLPGNPTGFETWLANEYVDYMQDEIFSPVGISNANCFPDPGEINTLAFSESNAVPLAINSATPGDWTELSGGGGYYLSVIQMARIMAYIAHTQVLFDADQELLMDSKYMGWDNEDSPMTYAGRAYGKDGALWWDSNTNGTQDNGDAGLQTFVMKFPNGVELALAINSIPGNYRSLVNLVRIAYDNAWED